MPGPGAAAVPVPCGGGRSADEVGERDVESGGDEEQVPVLGFAGRGLVPLDAPPLKAGAVGELVLREAGCSAGCGDAVAELDASVEDPFGSGVAAGGHG